jgi:hypothetical protein
VQIGRGMSIAIEVSRPLWTAERKANMFYQASNSEVSTRDWFALSFNTIPAALIWRADCEIDPSLVEDPGEEPEEPEEPNEDDFADTDAFTKAMSEYETAFEKWEEAHGEWEERQDNAGSEPMWSYVWESDDAKHCTDEALAVGLRVLTHDDLGTFFAADSGGHSFMGAYWIPLRARIARRQIKNDEAGVRVRLCSFLAREYRHEGEGGKDPCAVIGELLDLTPFEIAEARKLYEEGMR